jgi:hypothetical protein
MRWLKPIFATLLATLWFPVTSHCLLEEAGLIHYDACCEPAHADTGHGHDAADGACQVESSSYQLPKPHETLSPVLLDPPGPSFKFAAQPAAGALAAPESADSPPRLLAVTWQFSSRSAPSPRAPSALL